MMQANDLESALALDAEHRKRALDFASFIVEAPAGAGKTELLTQRYLKLLQTVQSPEEIIAITFTNKAASEMRVRIMDSLLLAANGEKNGGRPCAPHKQITFDLSQQALHRSHELGWQLLSTPSRLRIYTIDALCGNLARQMPLLSRFGTQPSVTEDAYFYYREAANKALEAMNDDQLGGIVQTVLRYFDNDQAKLTDLLVDMLAKREQWLGYAQNTYSPEMAVMALTHMVNNELAEIAQVMPARLQNAIMPIARYAASNLESEHPIATLIDWQIPLQAQVEDLPLWQALADVLLTNTGGLRKRLDKNMGLPATPEAKAYKDALTEILDGMNQHADSASSLARLRLLPDPTQHDGLWPIVGALSKLLNIAVAQLWLAFQAHNEVDFVEISQRALQALRDPEGLSTELALRLDYRIQHILVDEFQDTSPVQIELLKALTHGWQNNDNRTLFAVGDPMQSIYRFRKANVGLFLEVAQHGIGDIKLTPLKLSRNNRSCPPVVEWINQTFAHIFPRADNPNQGAIQYRPFVATKQDETLAGVSIHPLISNNAQEEDEVSTDIRQVEAERIIHIIRETWQHKPEARIAVLVRARRHLHALVTEMRRNHPELSFQAVEIEELANRQIVQDLLTLTHALHQRADRVHWLALLRAPWCGLTLADLHQLIGADSNSTVLSLMQDEHRIAHLSADGQTRLRHVRAVMQQALDYRGRTTISRWVHNTWLMLGGAECLWDANDVQDVQAFFARIQTLEQNQQFSPANLAEDVKKLYAAPNAKADDKLQFMTIHKSKGLEFDTVILPGLDGRSRGQDPALVLWEEVIIDGQTELIAAPLVPKNMTAQQASVTPYDYLNDIEKTRSDYETARVLYVAATRTERHLHLLGVAKLDKDGQAQAPKGTFLSLLWPSVHHAYTPENAIQAQAPHTGATDMRIDQFVPQLIRVQQAQAPSVLQAETSLAQQSAYANKPSAQPARVIEADIGTLTHLYLQLITEQGLNHWLENTTKKLEATAPAMQRWFKQKGYDSATCQSGAEQVCTLLNTTLQSEDGRWVLSEHAQAASELAIETRADGDEINKRIIDRTFVVDAVRWVIDYKTTALEAHSESHLKEAALAFLPQLESYAQLFAHETKAVKKAVYFVRVGRLVLLD